MGVRTWLVGLGATTCLATVALLVPGQGIEQLAPEPRVAAPRGDPPPSEKIFVWPVPDKGSQSVLVLRVVDGDTLEAAYLVPVVLRLDGIDAPELNTEAGRKSADALNKLIGGKLLPANLYGKEKYGRVLADLWLGKPDGEDTNQPSGWLTKWLVKNGHAKEWSGRGPKPKQEGGR